MNNMIKNKGVIREKRRGIKQIELSKRHVTFCKRRVGIYNKASELCAQTGAECAIVCESVAGRIFAFGHPSVESVVDKYLADTNSSELPKNNSEIHVNSLCMLEKLNKQYLEINKEMAIEKNKSVNVKAGINDNSSHDMEKYDLFWWQQPYEHLEAEELEEYISSMEKLMNNFKMRADDLSVIRSSSSMLDANKTVIDANKTVNSNDAGLSDDQYLANKNLIAEDVVLPEELSVNNNLNFSDDGLLNELLAMDPNFEDGLDFILKDFYLQDNNVQLPNTYGN